MMPAMQPRVRAARAEEPGAADLLHLSAAPYYDAYAGSERRARRLLRGLWPRPGHTASHEVCRVAVSGEAVVGVVAGFPLAESGVLANRFVAESLRRLEPWRWPGVWRHLRAAGRLTPDPPEGAWYVDALAVTEAARRRGVARALLDEATRQAREAGATGIALDTGVRNRDAQALYEAYGFARTDVRTALDPATARAIGGPGFVSYFKPTGSHGPPA